MSDTHDAPAILGRHSRQRQLARIGEEGQARLARAHVTIVGMGGLGTPAAVYLAAAGVGRLTLVDGDAVEASNLNRQFLYREEDLGRPKAEVAAERLFALDPAIALTTSTRHATADNVASLLGAADVVLDASDNFATRFLLNDACRLLGKPLVSAAVTQFAGQLSTYLGAAGPCYRCFFPEPPADGRVAGCAEEGILGAAAGAMGTLQALEALKVLLGAEEATLSGWLLLVDLWTLGTERIQLPRHPDCPLCGPDAWLKELSQVGTHEPRRAS